MTKIYRIDDETLKAMPHKQLCRIYKELLHEYERLFNSINSDKVSKDGDF